MKPTFLPARSAPHGEPPLEAGPLDQSAILCFSHLRWDFIYQRPQHLMTRFSRRHPVWFIEEPVPDDDGLRRLEIRQVHADINVVVPRLPAEECRPGHSRGEAELRTMVATLAQRIGRTSGQAPILWFYTPMAMPIAQDLAASLVVYDCMDQLADFDQAPAAMRARERALLGRADLVFTGGSSLFDAKKKLHAHAHLFPSSVDAAHFRRARTVSEDPADMAGMPHPRIGFFGVIDERLDLDLLARVVARRPEWHWVMLGPVVKIDIATLPQAANLHYLGAKSYERLPDYLGRWDVATMPFAINAATRFISPTKTPEYLAGGCPVVSTPVPDVVRGYRGTSVVRIGFGADEFVSMIDAALKTPARSPEVCREADSILDGASWDTTHRDMARLMRQRREALDRSATQRGAVPRRSERTLVTGLR